MVRRSKLLRLPNNFRRPTGSLLWAETSRQSLRVSGCSTKRSPSSAKPEAAFAKLGDEAGLTSVAELRRLIEQRKDAG